MIFSTPSRGFHDRQARPRGSILDVRMAEETSHALVEDVDLASRVDAATEKGLDGAVGGGAVDVAM